MIGSSHGRRGIRWASAAAALLLLVGCANPSPETSTEAAPATTATAATAETAQPAPEPTTTTSATIAAAQPEPAAPAEAPLPVLPASAPVSVSIPSLGVASELLRLGLQDNGTLEVPPGDPGSPAGWYIHSPTPGERGPAVLLGHVNAYGNGPGIFAGLRELQAGETIKVTREDGTTAVFAVTRGEAYAKDAFPTQSVYGNTAGSELRLITCDGYDPATGHFDENYVVYAKLLT